MKFGEGLESEIRVEGGLLLFEGRGFLGRRERNGDGRLSHGGEVARHYKGLHQVS